jgi:hypothetical protein
MSLLLLSIGACSPPEEAPEVCEAIPRPEMALSETELDFGDVLIRSTATRTVLLSNTGNYPLGVTSVEVGDAEEGSDFVVSYDVAGTDCASVPDDAYDREILDTGYTPWDADTATHWSGHAFVLEPGCTLPLTVTYTPTAYYTDADALITSSVAMGGVLIVFSYLVIPVVIVSLFARSTVRRLAAGWVMGFIGSVLGIYASYSYDMPTGAAVVATFGVLLVLALIVRALIPGEAHSVMGIGHA